jgi:hypothetical protein
LCDLINQFGDKGGFDLISGCMDKEDASVRDMAALLTPISNCAELLNRDSVEGTLSNCMDRAFKTVETLDDKVGGRAPRLIFAYSPL